MLNTSPANQTTIKTIESPSAEPRLKFSMIWGEKTTIQQAIDIELVKQLADAVSVFYMNDDIPTNPTQRFNVEVCSSLWWKHHYWFKDAVWS